MPSAECFERTNGDTDFLEEIGGTLLELQPCSLRVLEEKVVWRLTEFSNMLTTKGLGPAHSLATAWNGTGGWLIFSQSRQLNFSRIVSVAFHRRGEQSNVCVTSSPSLRRRLEPRHVRGVGVSITTRWRGRCSGNIWRSPRLHVNPHTVVVFATARFAAGSPSAAPLSNSPSVNANCSARRRPRVRPRPPKRSKGQIAGDEKKPRPWQRRTGSAPIPDCGRAWAPCRSDLCGCKALEERYLRPRGFLPQLQPRRILGAFIKPPCRI
jgi:hypothetical protein